MDPSFSHQTIRLSLPQLSDLAEEFLQDHKSYGAAVTEFLEYAAAAAPTVLRHENKRRGADERFQINLLLHQIFQRIL
ncbi:hypothetical protein TrVE_jg4703 [Triparma verrucosa]|uniref:Uncharacterized protein n=1 Tax=Triparma verrucosa TaxID=1606542 RepID=A0A9W7F1T2_9STRA|nr:hypothetical protein TrVE_jg4703 [Triparma verrucosa]